MWMRCECDCNGCIGRCGDAWNAEMIPEETMVLLYSPLGAYTPWVWGKTVGANSENMGDGTYREQHENNARARARTHTHTHTCEKVMAVAMDDTLVTASVNEMCIYTYIQKLSR